MSHPVYTLLLSILLSGAVALTGDRSSRDRAYAATYSFLACVVSVAAGGWFMYLVHR
jgi:hypothetical protein